VRVQPEWEGMEDREIKLLAGKFQLNFVFWFQDNGETCLCLPVHGVWRLMQAKVKVINSSF